MAAIHYTCVLHIKHVSNRLYVLQSLKEFTHYSCQKISFKAKNKIKQQQKTKQTNKNKTKNTNLFCLHFFFNFYFCMCVCGYVFCVCVFFVFFLNFILICLPGYTYGSNLIIGTLYDSYQPQWLERCPVSVSKLHTLCKF